MLRRPFSAAIVTALAILTFTTSADALFLGAGVSAPPDQFPPPSGTLLADSFDICATPPCPWSAGAASGTYETAVFSGDPANLAGGLTFAYLIHVDVGSESVVRTEMANFNGFLVDAGFAITSAAPTPTCPLCTGTGVHPMTDDRSLNGCSPGALTCGSTIGFNFTPGKITSGADSAILLIHTNASSFTAGTLKIINGSNDTVVAFAPFPEPSSLLLLGSGLIGLGLLVHRRLKG